MGGVRPDARTAAQSSYAAMPADISSILCRRITARLVLLAAVLTIFAHGFPKSIVDGLDVRPFDAKCLDELFAARHVGFLFGGMFFWVHFGFRRRAGDIFPGGRFARDAF